MAAPNESQTPSRRRQFIKIATARRRRTGSRQRQAVTKRGTIGESSNDGENDGGFCFDVEGRANSDGLPVGSEVGEGEEKKVVFVGPVGDGTDGMAGFGAMFRCFDDGGCGVWVRDGGVEASGESGGTLAARIGNVSAKSTIVLNEPLNMSQAISVLRPVPAAMIMRVIMKDIFNSVLPA
ncbi:uncharacterized protein N0V89_008536 [Didymosphaeria variabile]|uniref:Uncharacterized protein n=1 Tax=Didymosphaeria variabile TaxID=1932322 RepID=A0A9W8XFY5_9PLEO|nr:uncharacterized protein N0V89_008536 [Didymosphaeria variabile]KAJ4349916.1 hypothetical protein N0V89_008536 [Didymosphaeria variabile]